MNYFSTALGLTLAFVAITPAGAADWRTLGVSNRTRETVALDMDSIDRKDPVNIKFRYLIGKDVVNAKVNCPSSKVTPSKGKAFVPDMTGATRDMIRIVCRGKKSQYDVSAFEVGAVRNGVAYDNTYINVLSDKTISSDVENACNQFEAGLNLSDLLARQYRARNDTRFDPRNILDYFLTVNAVGVAYICPEHSEKFVTQAK